MRTLRLVVEYDGTHFAGWQSQKSGRTVQDALEQALHILLKEPIRLIGAGRTDAGTHALGQVAHFQTEGALPPGPAAPQPSTAYCPRTWPCAPPTKSPRTSMPATVRLASAIATAFTKARAAVNRTQVWTYYSELSLAPMAAAARSLCGERAFGAFCKQDPIPEHLTCRVSDAVWSQRGPRVDL